MCSICVYTLIHSLTHSLTHSHLLTYLLAHTHTHTHTHTYILTPKNHNIKPPQGVQEGEMICIQTEPKIEESSTLFRIPLGSWKDGLCDFCKYGPCHPSFLISCLFPLVSLGQIYTRMELNWNGSPYHVPTTKTDAFKSMVWLTFGYMFIKQICVSFQSGYRILYMLNFVYGVFVAILVGRTRRHIREKYDIPGTFTQIIQNNSRIADCIGVDGNNYGDDDDAVIPVCCGEMEDYCLGGCCYPCVLSQMSRHTAMYDTYEGSFFSSSGLPEHAPMMI